MEAYKEPSEGVVDNDRPINSSSYSSSYLITVIVSFWKDFDLESERSKL